VVEDVLVVDRAREGRWDQRNVREVIQRGIGRILVGVDGGLAIEANPRGFLGLEGAE
jgi:hypothetical protein